MAEALPLVCADVDACGACRSHADLLHGEIAGAAEQSVLRGAQGHGHRPREHRLLAELGDHEPRPERRQGAQLLLDGGHEQVPVAGDAAAEDHERRVDDRDDHGDRQREAPRLGYDDLAGEGVAASRGAEDRARRERRLHAQLPRVTHHAARRGRLLELPARAVGPVVRVALADWQVADLSGRPAGAAVELTADDDAEAHAGAYPEEDEVVDVAPQAVRPLAERGQVDVVLEGDAGTELVADGADHALAAPPREVGGVLDELAPRVEHPGAPHGGVGHARPLDAGVAGHLVSEPADLRDELALSLIHISEPTRLGMISYAV